MIAYGVLMSNMDAINPHVFQEYGLGFLGVLVLVTWSIANIEFTLSLRLLSSSRNNAKPLPTITSKPISIIILADNNSKRLQKLLEATRRVGYPLNKVIVIDYGDSDEGFSVAKRYSLIDERIHALKFERNSPSRFREELELERIGAAIAAGSDLILVFLRSNIVIAEPKTLLRLVMTYTNKSTVVLYMPRLICLTAGCKILNGALGILLYALIGIRRVYSLLQKSIPRYCCWSVHSTTYWKLFEFKEGSYMQDRYKNRGKWGQDSARLVLVDGGNAIWAEGYRELSKVITEYFRELSTIKRIVLCIVIAAIALLPYTWLFFFSANTILGVLLLASWASELLAHARFLRQNGDNVYYALLSPIFLVPITINIARGKGVR